jgi:aspartyl-tRNA(Asn)/glutamyl-tRNA(Gln) amidotransferase subunit B
MSRLDRYEPVIGLEVHAQLPTKTKLFTGAPNVYDPEHPNTHVNEYCFGLPGVLPVLNREVVTMSIRAGLALSCRINPRSVWSRKQYFYPDLPKGYQISQYDEPLCEDGHLDVVIDGTTKRIGIARIHMEEDAGKSVHGHGGSKVDFNRAGVPLIEIVSRPDLGSAREASAYLRELRAILMTIGVSDGNMQEGSFRCDANVSIRPRGQRELGTRCEIKNVNSFKFIEQAIDFEIARHATILDAGQRVEQETRLYDSDARETRSMRGKEEAHDYRYFPDPDLPVLEVSSEWIASIHLPELPAAKRERYVRLGLPREHAETFAAEKAIADYYDAAVARRPERAVAIAHVVKGEVLREIQGDAGGIVRSMLSAETLADLVDLEAAGRISASQLKKLFTSLWREGGDLLARVAAMGEQVSGAGALEPIVDGVLAENAENVARYKAGKTAVINALVGQVMKATQGRANPAVVKQLLEEKLRA